MMTLFKIISLSLLLSLSALAKESGHADVSLQLFEEGGKSYFATIFKNEEHWHTYWKNPGDAGNAPEWEWVFENKKILPQALEWPVPKTFLDQGDMLAYGYEGEYAFFFEIPSELLSKTSPFELSLKWLNCNNICIWGEKKIHALLDKKALRVDTPASFSWSEEQLKKAFRSLPQEIPWPKDLNLKVYLSEDKENLVAQYDWQEGLKDQFPSGKNLLIPFPGSLFLYRHESLLQRPNGTLQGTLPIQWEGKWRNPESPLPEDGLFKTPLEFKFLFIHPQDGTVSVIKTEIKSFLLSAPVKETPPAPRDEHPIPLYLLFAFIGGLILNLMPCVLPVISLKLFGILKKTKISPREILAKNLAYTFGILLSFLVLAFVVIGLKKSGEEIGWGFQLQSPLFVSALIIVLFVFALNLFGLFEFKTPGGRFLGTIKVNQHFTGDIFEGILATLLSTPCSAPFLGTALGFAFHSSPFMIICIFLCIGLGLAFPFILSGFFPKTIHLLPKPGVWMENLKRFLGLALIFTIIWLFYVLLSQLDRSIVLIHLLVTLTIVFFTFFLSSHITKKKRWKILFVILSLVAMSLFFISAKGEGQKEELTWETWSGEKMSEFQKTTFLAFTAQWCLTCKVNEKLVLRSEEFKQLVKKHDLRLLKGDWTKKDPAITAFLEQRGSSAVPAYFIQDKAGKLHPLSELISIEKIENGLRKAEEK